MSALPASLPMDARLPTEPLMLERAHYDFRITELEIDEPDDAGRDVVLQAKTPSGWITLGAFFQGRLIVDLPSGVYRFALGERRSVSASCKLN